MRKLIKGIHRCRVAVQRQDYAMFNTLLLAGAEYESLGDDLYQFLLGAIKGEKYTTIKLLITHCNIKIPPHASQYPLPSVIKDGHEGVARLLIEIQPDLLNLPNILGETPLDMAIRYVSPSLLRKLLAAGADPFTSHE